MGKVDCLTGWTSYRCSFDRPVDWRETRWCGNPAGQSALSWLNEGSQERVAVEGLADRGFPRWSIEAAAELQLNDKRGRIAGEVLRQPK